VPLSGFAGDDLLRLFIELGSIALGATLLQTGHWTWWCAGGYDTISEYAYGALIACDWSQRARFGRSVKTGRG